MVTRDAHGRLRRGNNGIADNDPPKRRGSADHNALGDVSGPSVEPVDRTAARADLPAENKQNSDRDHQPGDHDGDRHTQGRQTLVLDTDPELRAALVAIGEGQREGRNTSSLRRAYAALEAALYRALRRPDGQEWLGHQPDQARLKRRMARHFAKLKGL